MMGTGSTVVLFGVTRDNMRSVCLVLCPILGLLAIRMAVGIFAAFYRRKARVAILSAVASIGLLISAYGALAYTFHTEMDLGSMELYANRAITKAGGPAQVCEEGKQILERFRTNRDVVNYGHTFLSPAELRDFPAVAAVTNQGAFQKAHLFRGNPPMFTIRFGGHLDGFTMEIVDRDGDPPDNGQAFLTCRRTAFSFTGDDRAYSTFLTIVTRFRSPRRS
jgi:hypothetical protein